MSGSRARKAVPVEVRRQVFAEEYVCGYCGYGSEYVELDHIMPWSRGGSNERSNLTLACHFCNREKSDMTLEEWMDYRESNGASWPPPDPISLLAEIVAAMPPGETERMHGPLPDCVGRVFWTEVYPNHHRGKVNDVARSAVTLIRTYDNAQSELVAA